MSSTLSDKEWFIWVPCFPNKDEIRFQVRPDHIKHALHLRDIGVMKWGGGILERQTAPGDTSGMTFSVMTVYADTQDEALKVVTEDVYTKNGIWDVDNVKIYPMKTTIRLPL